jgi:hypothetical protein
MTHFFLPKHTRSLMIIITAILLTACFQQLSPEDKLQSILFSTYDCEAPCWQGIMPGESTEKDFLDLVDSSPSKNFDQLNRNELSEGLQYLWYDRSTSILSSLDINNDVISFVNFQFVQGENLTLESVINTLGPPDFYTARVSSGERDMFNFNVFYEDKGIAVNFRIIPFSIPASASHPDCQVEITSNMPARSIYFVAPGTVEELQDDLDRVFFIHEEPKPWPGLGVVHLTLCYSKH